MQPTYGPRTFLLKYNLHPLPDAIIGDQIKSAHDNIQGRYTSGVDKAFSLLHQKTATGRVKEDHDKWKHDLDVLIKKMKDQMKLSDNRRKYIPIMKDRRKIAESLSCMVYCDALYSLVENELDALRQILASPLHWSALEFFKTIEERLAALEKLGTNSNNVDDFSAIFTELNQKRDELLRKLQGNEPLSDAVNKLYAQLSDLILDALDQYDGKLNNVETKEAVARLKEKYAPQRAAADAAAEEVTDYVEKSCKVELAYHDEFLNGGWGITWWHSHVSGQVAQLRKVTQANKQMLTELKLRLEGFFLGKFASQEAQRLLQEEKSKYDQHLIGFKKLVQLQLNSLIPQGVTSSTLAARHYALQTLDKIKETSRHLPLFARIIDPAFLPYAKAVGSVIKYLNPLDEKDYSLTSLRAVQNLFAAVLAAYELQPVANADLEALANKTHWLVDAIISNVASQTVVLTQLEMQVEQRLLREESLDGFDTVLESYLMKGLLRRILGYKQDAQEASFKQTLQKFQEREQYAATVQKMQQLDGLYRAAQN